MEQGTPQIPSLKQTQKKPGGMGGLAPGLSFVERLKQFKRKDLAFITAGLSVLFMAPVAEHFLMNPDAASTGTMTPGWDMKKGAGFGDGSSPYESGVNGLAPGGVTGGGDVITPLNVRDPASLILGPGASSQPPATATTPAPPKNDSGDWKDAIANAGSAAAKKAVEKAGLPVPKPSLSNAGLRGLGAVSGGGGGSYALPPVSAGLAPNKAAESNSLQRVQAAPGFRGVGPRGGENASAGSMESLKKAAAGAVDVMNRRGSASSAAEQAASLSMGGGGSSGGGAGAGGPDGPADKASSGSQNKDSSNVGESLDFMRRKAEQDKAIDLQWKLKEKDAMLLPNLKEKALDTMSMGLINAMVARAALQFKTWGSNIGGGGAVFKCKGAPAPIPANRVGSCDNASDPDYAKGLSYFFEEMTGNMYAVSSLGCSGSPKFTECVKEGGSDSSSKEDKGPERAAPGNLPGLVTGKRSGKTLKEMCEDLGRLKEESMPGLGSPQAEEVVSQFKTIIRQINEADVNLMGDSSQFVCEAQPFEKINGNVKTLLEKLRGEMVSVQESLNAAVALGKSAVGAVKETGSAKEASSLTGVIDGYLSTYVIEKKAAEAATDPETATARNKAAAQAWDSAATEAEEYESIYKEAHRFLKGESKEKLEIDEQLEAGTKKLPGIDKKLNDAEGYLSKAEKLLEEARSGQADVKSKLEQPGLQIDVKTAKDWLEDITQIRSKVEQENYQVRQTDAKQIRNAYKAAEAAVDSQGKPGPVPISTDHATEIVGPSKKIQSQKDLSSWAKENIQKGNMGDAQSGQTVKDGLIKRSNDLSSEVTRQLDEEVPKAEEAVRAIDRALKGEEAP